MALGGWILLEQDMIIESIGALSFAHLSELRKLFPRHARSLTFYFPFRSCHSCHTARATPPTPPPPLCPLSPCPVFLLPAFSVKLKLIVELLATVSGTFSLSISSVWSSILHTVSYHLDSIQFLGWTKLFIHDIALSSSRTIHAKRFSQIIHSQLTWK